MFCPKEQTIRLIFSLLSYHLMEGEKEEKDKYLCGFGGRGRCFVLFCFFRALEEHG